MIPFESMVGLTIMTWFLVGLILGALLYETDKFERGDYNGAN